MKAILVPILLMICVFSIAITCSCYAEKSLNDMIEQAESLPEQLTDDTLSLIKNIEKEWNKHKENYSAISRFDFVYNFSKEISAAKAGCIADDTGTYLAAKNSMINILKYLRDTQKLRLDNII